MGRTAPRAPHGGVCPACLHPRYIPRGITTQPPDHTRRLPASDSQAAAAHTHAHTHTHRSESTQRTPRSVSPRWVPHAHTRTRIVQVQVRILCTPLNSTSTSAKMVGDTRRRPKPQGGAQAPLEPCGKNDAHLPIATRGASSTPIKPPREGAVAMLRPRMDPRASGAPSARAHLSQSSPL